MPHQEIGHIQLPPDSTGKKSAATGRLVIQFTGEVSPNYFAVNDDVTGIISGATGRIVGINRNGYPAGDGQIYIEVSSLAGTFVVNEGLRVGATTIATVFTDALLDELYYQKNTLVDRDSPDRSLVIDDLGAANVSFSEGQPSLSSFGGLIVNEPTTTRQYVYAYDGLPNEFYSTSGVDGNFTYNADQRSVTLDTGGTASGSFVKRVSHYYHPYQPGTMSRILQSVLCGDTGKADVVRRWGLFDDDNGLFWELDGTNLYVVIRSNATGSVVDTRVIQSDFNRDKLDGSTNFNINIDQMNLYWIDYQWLGVGVVRFGVYSENGQKITAHIFENPNSAVVPYTRQGVYPVGFECRNINTAASASELKTVCSATQVVGRVKNQYNSHSTLTETSRTISAADGEVPILTIRPKADINGIRNSALMLLDNVVVHNSDSKNLQVKIQRGTFPSGASWSDAGGSVEVDTSASGWLPLGSGAHIWTHFIPSGETWSQDFFQENPNNQADVGMILLGGDVQIGISVVAKNMSAGDTDVTVAVNWKETRQ